MTIFPRIHALRASARPALGLATVLCWTACASDDTQDDDGSEEDDDGGEVPEGCDAYVEPSDDDDETVQSAFTMAEDGDTVCLGEGEFVFAGELVASKNELTIRGAGEAETVLDFSGQQVGSGANGIKIEGDGVTVEELTIANTAGDGIRADQVEGITFRHVTARWDALHSSENGAYGLYPVLSTDVVIDSCTVSGSRDAGIYVGQSERILVENSVAFDNVAGIEIENSFDAVVRNNEAYDNTGGLLIFNLPSLQLKNGERTLVYDNHIHDNNVPNWGDPGTSVGQIPAGSGIILMAADHNEIRDNDIHDNRSFGIAVTSYTLLDPTGEDAGKDPEFDAYAQSNFVHGNVLENNGYEPDTLIADITLGYSPVPALLTDGCEPRDQDPNDASLLNCMFENVDETGAPAGYLDLDVCNNFVNQSIDIGPVTCEYDPLPDPYPA